MNKTDHLKVIREACIKGYSNYKITDFGVITKEGKVMKKPKLKNKKSINQIIAEYVERRDVIGLADYFRAYLEDEVMEKK
jgi:hypothetical protein